MAQHFLFDSHYVKRDGDLYREDDMYHFVPTDHEVDQTEIHSSDIDDFIDVLVLEAILDYEPKK